VRFDVIDVPCGHSPTSSAFGQNTRCQRAERAHVMPKPLPHGSATAVPGVVMAIVVAIGSLGAMLDVWTMTGIMPAAAR
jgi:hypothetical protein